MLVPRRDPTAARGCGGVPGLVIDTFLLLYNVILAPAGRNCHSAMASWQRTVRKRNKTKLGKDKRRKHHHWQVTVYYHDGEKFARVYINRDKAVRFADRQKKSPVVKLARVSQLS